MKNLSTDRSDWYRHVSVCVMAGALVAPNMAHAIAFEPLRQSRSVEISGEIRSFNFQTLENQSAVFSDDSHSLPDGWDPLRLGMNISLPDDVCFGQGVATQSLTAGGSAIKFSGIADVNISGFPTYPYMLNGRGDARVAMEYSFNVAHEQAIELWINSAVAPYQDDDFSFRLVSSSGELIWWNTAVLNEQGETSREIKKNLLLQPGEYTVAAVLRASSNLSGDYSSAGRTWAEFGITAITPVPEPSSSLMTALGLLAVLLVRMARVSQARTSRQL